MKKIHILSITLFAILAFGVVSAGSASAAETAQWLVNGATIALTEAVNVDITGELLLEDLKATLKPDTLCLEVLGLGFLYSNGEGRIAEEECMSLESMTSGVTCEKSVLLHLPWLTQLVQTTGGEFLDEIKNGGAGAPGWSITCTALGVKVTDECTNENGKPIQVNHTATEEIESVFGTVAKSEEANCTVGGKEEGMVEGSLFLNALNAAGTELLALTVSLAPEVS